LNGLGYKTVKKGGWNLHLNNCNSVIFFIL
jgi:hypothetical protein